MVIMPRYISALLRNASSLSKKVTAFVVIGKNQTENERKTKAQAIFLNPLTVWSSCKQKFVVCPFFDEEKTDYPFATDQMDLTV